MDGASAFENTAMGSHANARRIRSSCAKTDPTRDHLDRITRRFEKASGRFGAQLLNCSSRVFPGFANIETIERALAQPGEAGEPISFSSVKNTPLILTDITRLIMRDLRGIDFIECALYEVAAQQGAIAKRFTFRFFCL